mmetsp:Transcript_143/g.212  ORF Transcript_143/g.212 Transcript_143/m.212 type:complete len:914 (+) Transcript_143:88-2829(+)
MDPSRNDFNGSGLPPHRRQGQDQGTPQQFGGFPFQEFQNRRLAQLNGMERNRELRELQDQILLRQELERRQRAIGEHQAEIMSQLAEGKYTQLTRNNDNPMHRQQPMNMQGPGNGLMLNPEDAFQLSVQRQNATFQQLVQRQHEIHHRREFERQQKLQEYKQRQFQDLLLSRMVVGENASQNESVEHEAPNEFIDPLVKKRRRSVSGGGSVGSTVNVKSSNKKNGGKKKQRGNSKAKSKQKKTIINIDAVDTEPPQNQHQHEIDRTGVIDMTTASFPDINEKSIITTKLKEIDEIDERIDALRDTVFTGKNIQQNNDSSTNVEEVKTAKKEPKKRDTLEALIEAAKKSNSDSDNEKEKVPEPETKSKKEDEGVIKGMQMLLAAVNPNNGRFSDDEAVNLMRGLREIASQDPTAPAYFGMLDLQNIEISPGHFASIPQLPEEPEFDESEAKKNPDTDSSSNEDKKGSYEFQKPSEVRRDVKVPTFLDNAPRELKLSYDIQTVDNWFPTSSAIRRERRAHGLGNDDREVQLGSTKTKTVLISEEMNKRLRHGIEPGVLEKVPHCKVYCQSYLNQYGKLPKEPVFCCQVTETHCQSTMLCCSICSTWRHAECGGHYTHYSPKSTEENFKPICDRCYKEQVILNHYPLAEKRLARQRSIQLRTVHAVTAIMRNSAYAKHGGTYKWPLGSVSSFQIGSHTKSIHLRHERAEKQWKEMAAKLNCTSNSKSSRAKSRTRDFERLMVNLEDAEGQTDRHNMTLFLEWDLARDKPVGFEKPCLNFFDPAEDDQTEQHFHFVGTDDDDDNEGDIYKDGVINGNGNVGSKDDKSGLSTTPTTLPLSPYTPTTDDNRGGRIIARPARVRQSPKSNKSHCIRAGCKNKPRFDSSFCSDACGIWTMEKDLLCSLQYASEMHPYQLRP